MQIFLHILIPNSRYLLHSYTSISRQFYTSKSISSPAGFFPLAFMLKYAMGIDGAIAFLCILSIFHSIYQKFYF